MEILNEKLHGYLTVSNLDRSHRIGQKKASSDKPRAIIVRFVSCNTRKRIFLNKRLKGTQISVAESVTAKIMGFLKEAREKYQFCNVRTGDGKILYKDGNDNKVKLYYI